MMLVPARAIRAGQPAAERGAAAKAKAEREAAAATAKAEKEAEKASLQAAFDHCRTEQGCQCSCDPCPMANMYLCAACGDIKGVLCRKRACKEARGDDQGHTDEPDIDAGDLMGSIPARPIRSSRRARSGGAGQFE